jgi:hypothetical protein
MASPNAALEPRAMVIASALVMTSSQASTVFELPNDADEIILYVQVTAASGTTPTLNAALQHTPDGGTTWLGTGNNTASMTAASIRGISLSRQRSFGQSAAEFSADVPAAGGAAASANGPLMRKCRIWFVIGGTTPSFTVNAWVVVPAKAYG